MTAGIGIDFYIANKRKEIPSSEKHVKFEEDLQHYLLEKEGDPAKKYGLLLNLDQYRNRVFSGREINELVIICEHLLNEYSVTTKKPWEVDKITKGINRFAEELRTLCLAALDQKKKVFAIGD
ncbi:MAG: hypothetical protein H9W80_12880 [Enterococcus sp.]|nr:hypothetical protein [Enterococcus sp.]